MADGWLRMLNPQLHSALPPQTKGATHPCRDHLPAHIVCVVPRVSSYQGRRILDSGLRVCWGDGQHWAQLNEPTSPRDSIWHLNSVCWLSVQATVLAPPTGCYAAFFRVRQPAQRRPLLGFSAEWKVAATTAVSKNRPRVRVGGRCKSFTLVAACGSRRPDCRAHCACSEGGVRAVVCLKLLVVCVGLGLV